MLLIKNLHSGGRVRTTHDTTRREDNVPFVDGHELGHERLEVEDGLAAHLHAVLLHVNPDHQHGHWRLGSRGKEVGEEVKVKRT